VFLMSEVPLHLNFVEGVGVAEERSVRPAPPPPWRKPRGKYMVSLVYFHSNTTSRRKHLWEIELRFAPRLPPGWCGWRTWIL